MFSPDANWIWLAKKDRDKNSYAVFRRSIDLPSLPKSATVAITADSRYELYINNTFLGHGPVRSWPSPWPVDTYDIRHLLIAGKNQIEILVTHFGLSTFQYLDDEPGLIAQLNLDDKTIVTDSSWQSAPHTSYLWPAPRITCQQAWEEQFDARAFPKDIDFTPAKILRPAGRAPHPEFEPRDIPMLTLDPVEPISIRAIEAVRPADYQFALNPREFVTAADKSANHIIARMLLTTTIDSPREQKIDLHQPHTRPFLPWKLNGEELNFDDKTLQKTDTAVAHATFKKGLNTLMTKLPESEHHFWANLNIWTEQPVTFSPWLAAGPFAGGKQTHVFDKVVILPDHIDESATADLFASIWTAGKLEDAQKSAPYVRPLTSDMIATTDAYATCASDRPDPSINPRIDNPSAMLHDNADWTTIHPSKNGADIRILFDYGKESIGFQEFELDAPAGTIIDTCNFEFIQRDGRFNLNESMNNSFRYICREGVQKYKTFLRRGLKYSWLVLRNFDKPVRIRLVRALMSTYPQTNIGSFECSDARLTQIWRTGVRSVECCSEDTYTDCPTYEQTFWVGDSRNEALVDLVANGDARLSGRCLRLTGKSLDRSSITESQVPSGWQNLLPTWTFLWMRWTQEHYQLTGDKEFAKEMLAYLDRNFAGLQKEINADGLFNLFAWNLFDWAPMDTPASAIVTHINCLLSQALLQTAELATDLGEIALAEKWTTAARGVANAVNSHLWSKEKRAYLDSIHKDGKPSPVFSQQTQTAAYISGVATAGGGDRADRCREIVHNPPENFVKAGSPFFMFFLLEALVRENRFDALIDTIRNYWGKQTDAGATTFWEMYHEPDDPGPFTNENRLTRSHCHGWSAAPTFFLTQYVLGIRPHEPGYATVLVAPHPGSLTFAQGRVPTPHGPVDCYWTSSEKRFDLSIEVSSGIPTRIELPLKGKVTVVEGKADVKDTIVTSTSARIKVTVTA